MPLYEYECQVCEHKTETLRPMADADKPVECEQCGSKKTKRAHSIIASATVGASAHVHSPGCGHCGDPRGSCSN